MTIIFILLILLAAILFVIVLAGLFLPTNWVVEKAVLIHTPSATLFPLLNELQAWEQWTDWNSKNNDFSFTYQGAKKGVGAIQKWKSKQMNATLTIQQSTNKQQIDYTMLINEGNLVLSGTIVLGIADAEFTQVAWRCGLEPLKGINPIRKFQAYFIKSYFDKAIENNLVSLQSIFTKK